MYDATKIKGLSDTGISICYITFIIAILLLLFCPSGWAADDKKDLKTTDIGEIIVTSTKMNTEVDKIPTNISVISREEIEKYPGHYNVITLLQELNIPGLYLPHSSADIDVSVSSRGSDVSQWGMRLMINGIELNNGNGAMRPGRMAVHDIERIEIIKTPSAEYGDQAMGGVINIITRKAKKPLEAKAGVAYTSLGSGNTYSVINGSNENWEYYVDASLAREDSYQHGGYFDINNVYTTVKRTLNNDSTLAFHGSYTDSKGNYTAGMTREQFNEDPTQNPNSGADYYSETEESLGALVYEQNLGPHELMCKMEVQDTSWRMYSSFYMGGDSLVAHPEVRMAFNHDIGGMANKLVIGAEYRYHDLDAIRYTATSFHDLGAKTQDFTRNDISYASYLQDELVITDALTVTAGIRYDYFDLEQEANMASSKDWSSKHNALSPKIGFTYQFCDEVNLFAGFNSGIKSPVRLRQWFTNGELNPEKLYSYEVGIRGNISHWLDYNMAFFWQNVTDKFVRPTLADWWNGNYENAGETSSKGVEMGANARLPHGFYASASFTYQESKFDEFVSGGVDYSGNYLTGVPKMIFAFKLGYQHETLGDISINPVYTGKRYFNYANTNEESGDCILNARYAKKFGRVEFYTAANNIFDKSVVATGGGNPGSETLYPMPGFNALIGLNVAF